MRDARKLPRSGASQSAAAVTVVAGVQPVARAAVSLPADYCRGVRTRAGWLVVDPFWYLVGLLLAVLLVHLRRTTAGLDWPFDLDLYRDIGQAESVLQGRLFADVNYRGEVGWYNPLLSWILAATAKVTGASVATIATQGGVVLNLLAPIAFTVVVRRWFGRLAAGFGLVAYVFLLCGEWPSWAVVTYSPWLFQANFAQGVFFLGLLALPGAIDGDRARPALVFGALLGLVALAHTAPALILLATFLVVVAWRTWSEVRPMVTALRRIALVGVAAVVVASPFLVPLAWRYQFRVLNAVPSSWVWDELQPNAFVDFAERFAVRWPILVTAVGALVWWWQRRREPVDVPLAALVVFTVTSGLALALSVYSSTAKPLADLVPHVVPSYHFLRYLSAAGAAWFGIGAAALIRMLVRVIRVRWRFATPVIAMAVAGAMTLISLPLWSARFEIHPSRTHALYISDSVGNLAVSRWIAETSERDDVILYDLNPIEALVVGPVDGRTTVAVDPVFSNPYVAWHPRGRDAAIMVESLKACTRPDPISEIFEQYGVKYVVTPAAGPLATSAAQCPALHVVYTDAYCVVLSVKKELLR